MMKIFDKLSIFICVLCIMLICTDGSIKVDATEVSVQNPKLTCKSQVKIDKVFGDYMSTVDENIYYSLSIVNGDSIRYIYGNYDTPMFNMLKDNINPCMALATTWGEAGSSYPNVSLTTVCDFNPSTYKDPIDWLSVSQNLEMINEDWYYANATSNYNVNKDGYAYHIPNRLLQNYDANGTLESLGVGPYQITSSDWDYWILGRRVNPVLGFKDSLRKCGTSWINCGITPISDITVYAALSLGHQGGGLINQQFGKDLINTINDPKFQEDLLSVGYQMYSDARDKAMSKSISLSDINVSNYTQMLMNKTGISFSSFHVNGYGPTNKGTYVINHTLRYVFYKFYYTEGF